MKTMRKCTEKTCKNLLAAAVDVFAEKGYLDSTVTEICTRAGANIAAGNYHFRDKRILYRESWRHVFSDAVTGTDA